MKSERSQGDTFQKKTARRQGTNATRRLLAVARGSMALRRVIADGPTTEERLVTVCYGMFTLTIEPEGKSVKDLRQHFRKQLAIPDDAVAVCDGQLIHEDDVVLQGQYLAFIKPAGEMG